MLTPTELVPKGKAASIWSLDSGYGSHTVEVDNHVQATRKSKSSWVRAPIGLGIEGLCGIHVEKSPGLSRPESPANPITSKVNVFAARAYSPETPSPPVPSGEAATCVACRLWSLTSPGEGLKCESCKDKQSIRPALFDIFGSMPKVRPDTLRINIPRESRSKRHAVRLRVPSSDLPSPISPIEPLEIKRSCAKRPAKLPLQAVQQLRAWLSENRDDPYPSSNTKRHLAEVCGITEKQVTTWFTNTRARKWPLPNERSYSSSGDESTCESELSSTTAPPIRINNSMYEYSSPNGHAYTPLHSDPSTHDQSPLTLQISRRGKKKDWRRANTLSLADASPVPRTPAIPSSNPNASEPEMWQCTFCLQPLVPKSWRRHEETQHRPKYQWTCLSDGPLLTLPSPSGTTVSVCAFCQVEDPSNDHFLHAHRIVECSQKCEADRTFGRPDHLRQHIKNFHRTSLLDSVRNNWRRDGPGKNVNEGWTCGFCDKHLETWDMRETHISTHFKEGLTMAAWRDLSQTSSKPAPAPRFNNSKITPPTPPTPPTHPYHFMPLTPDAPRLDSHTFPSPSHNQLGPHIPFNASYSLFPISPVPTTTYLSPFSTPPALPDIPPLDLSMYLPETNTTPFMTNTWGLNMSQAAPHLNDMYPTLEHAFDVYTGDAATNIGFEELENMPPDAERPLRRMNGFERWDDQ